jgi:hypothetical protein
MINEMKADFKIWRQIKGRGSFAHVYVQLLPCNKHSEQVIEHLSNYDKVWVDAAIKGCYDAINVINNMGIDTSQYQVQLCDVITTYTDSNINVIHVSAFLATAKALKVIDKFELYFDSEWKVSLPYRF